MPNFFWDEDQMFRDDQKTPTILAIGDSWFWYPFIGGSLVNNIGDIVKSKGHVILAKGKNGAEAYDYVDGKYASIVNNALRLYGKGLSAVLISGGGNDFAGFSDMRPLLKADCSSETTAAGCFRSGADGIDEFMDRIDYYYRKLIGLIYTRTRPGCKIIMHTYDYAIPDGQGVLGSNGWLKPALVNAGVAQELQQQCVKYLLDRFYEVLAKIAVMDPQNLIIVDSRGTLVTAEWHNELHPTGDGFEKIAKLRWKPILQYLELAN